MSNSLYLDTNIYLSFYHLTNEDIKELRKLLVFVKNGEITLYLPKQTIDEFYRNRDTKIADGFKKFRENKINNIFPQIVKDYNEEYNLMRKAIREFEKNKKIIIDKLKEDVIKKELNADTIIKEIFKIATIIETSDELIQKSKTRFDLGNTPGKKGSYGDALNWECLLEKVDVFENFFFISDDGDYFSEFDKDYFNSFLLQEWEREKPLTEFKFYKSLSKFFNEHYPNITLESEIKKDDLIKQITTSGAFATTRILLYKISEFNDFTRKQLNEIFDASINNSQIYRIGKDEDINEIFYKLLRDNKININIETRKKFEDLIPENLKADSVDNLPF